LDTSALVRPAALEALGRDAGPVVLLSDHPADLRDAHFTQVFPPNPWRDVGIAGLVAREIPSPQVMVTIQNASPRTTADLHVSSAGQDVARRIELPAAGTTSKVFIDLPRLGDVIEAHLAATDDLEADHTAWLARAALPPRVELRAPVPETLRRMVEVYTQARPPREGSPVVAVVRRTADLLGGDVGVIVESPLSQNKISGGVRVTDDPLTAVVDWSEAVKDASVSPWPAGDWKPLVSAGDRVLVAAREGPGRQVWVGFDSPQWPRSADFVVFWTNVFDWLGGAGQGFTADPVTIQGDEWKRQDPAPPGVQANAWPGVFRGPDGRLKAMNVGGMRAGGVGGSPSNPAGPILEGNMRGRSAVSYFCMAAMACVVAAALLQIPAPRHTPRSA
jgi:hypothetical protein